MFYYQLLLTKEMKSLAELTQEFITDHGWIYIAQNKEECYLVTPTENTEQDLLEKVAMLFSNTVSIKSHQLLTQDIFLEKIGSEQLGLVGAFLLQQEKQVEKPKPLRVNQAVLDELLKVIGLNNTQKSFRHLVTYLAHQEKQQQSEPIVYIFNGKDGTGKKYAINLLERLFGLQMIVLETQSISVPKLKSTNLPIVLHYLNSSDYRKQSVFREILADGVCPLKVFIVDSKEEAEALEKELSQHFYQIEVLDFPEYSSKELSKIACRMLEKQGIRACQKELQDLIEQTSDLSNSRAIRQFVQKVVHRALESGYDFNQSPLLSVTNIFPKTPVEEVVSTAMQDLQEMIGLQSVKRLLNQQITYSRLQKSREKYQLPTREQSNHLVFSGNPGTGKTEVARLYTKILYDYQLIKKDTIIEVGRADLIGEYVGQTAPKIKKIFDEAEGGVLFIDEAYSLIPQSERDFANEAIPALIQEMENRRDRVIVVFAGYTDLMAAFLDTNPGFQSRIGKTIVFEDYSSEELVAIFELQLSKRGYTCEKDCRSILLKEFPGLCQSEHSGNARLVRQIIEGAIYYQAQRLVSEDELYQLSKEDLMVLTVTDIQESLDSLAPKSSNIKSIGFRMSTV